MKHTLAGLALALVFFTVAPKANAQEELSNAQSTITVAVPTGGFSCGRSSYPLYCYGVPANIGGTFWLDAYYGAQNGFILFNNMADLGQATITSSSVIKNAGGFVTQLTVGFKATPMTATGAPTPAQGCLRSATISVHRSTAGTSR